jgi:pimeloyl-ACP methyl ester carboxylesterase
LGNQGTVTVPVVPPEALPANTPAASLHISLQSPIYRADERLTLRKHRAAFYENGLPAMKGIHSLPSGVISRRGFLNSAAGVATGALVGNSLFAQDRPCPNFVANRDCSIRLPDGRRLAYAEYGDPAACWTVIHQHGIPGCRLEAEFFRDALQCRPGVRLLAVDRPGFGCSDSDPKISYLIWPTDIANLADALRINCFSITSYSAGAPYALATARAMPNRVSVVSLGCPVAPFEAVDTRGAISAKTAADAVHHPWVSEALFSHLVTSFRRHPAHLPLLVYLQAFHMGAADHAYMNDPTDRQLYYQIVDEAFHQGTPEVVHAITLLNEPWAYWLKDVHAKVHIIQGGDDHVVRPGMSKELAAMLPDADYRLIAKEGHLTLQRHHAQDVLDAALPSG